MDAASRIHDAVHSFSTFLSGKPKVVEPPKLLNPVRHAYGEFEFQLDAPTGKPVELQISRDFQNWERLDSIKPAQELSAISDRKAGEFDRLFYRAVAGDLKSNYLGFICVELPAGYSMISNPLHSPSHCICDLFPKPPEGAILSKFSLVTYSISNNKFEHGKWEVPDDTFLPGEGALFLNPMDGPIQARFVGDVPKEPQTTPLQKGTSMRGALLPMSGQLDADLSFPIAPGDAVSLYHPARKEYLEYKFTEKGWGENAPKLGLCEAFWVAKNQAALWMQKLPEGAKK